jgi:aspartate/methionine/tyrosine aminotransferase
MDPRRLISSLVERVEESGIRKVFEEARGVEDPINLCLGQPDFPVPAPIKRAAIEAIQNNQNGYSSNRGLDPLVAALADHLAWDLGWNVSKVPKAEAGQASVIVTSGTSGALVTAAMCLLDPGDEIIFADPYFVLYPPLAQMTGAKIVLCDTYPDFKLTAARVAPLITARTKMVLLNSPGNPTGVVLSVKECRDLAALCREKGVVLISDEIYDEFAFSESVTQGAAGEPTVMRCPSPARVVGGVPEGEQESMLVVRGFGKTYGVTGWRLGYCAGPSWLIDRMVKLQMHLYICAPTPLQMGAIEALRTPLGAFVADYEKRRDMVCETFRAVTEVATPGGAFYAFVKVPERLGMTATQFKELAKSRRVLVVPSSAFGRRDTHFRISFAAPIETLKSGLTILAELMRAGG